MIQGLSVTVVPLSGEVTVHGKLRIARNSLIAIRNELEESKDLDVKAVIQLCKQALEETK